MARPTDFSLNMDKSDSLRFVKELIRVDSLPVDSEELVEKRNFLKRCRIKAEKYGWKS